MQEGVVNAQGGSARRGGGTGTCRSEQGTKMSGRRAVMIVPVAAIGFGLAAFEMGSPLDKTVLANYAPSAAPSAAPASPRPADVPAKSAETTVRVVDHSFLAPLYAAAQAKEHDAALAPD